jgi:hypothetical protein
MEQTANESYQQVREPPARHAWCVAELKHCNNETWSTALIRCLWSRIVDQTTAALSGDWQTDGTALPYLFRVGRSFELASQLTVFVWSVLHVLCHLRWPVTHDVRKRAVWWAKRQPADTQQARACASFLSI